jgi:hypothetical protein
MVAGVTLVVLSQAWAWQRLAPRLPPLFPPSRSPSSDVLMQTVAGGDVASRLAVLDALLPLAPGVVVAHGRADAMASAYMVISMHLWPRPVSLVACEPAPHVEQFRVPHTVPRPAWRIDIGPGHDNANLQARPTTTSDAAVLCREDAP